MSGFVVADTAWGAHLSGAPASLTDLTVSLATSEGVSVLAPTSSGIVLLSDGRYRRLFDPLDVGRYTITWAWDDEEVTQDIGVLTEVPRTLSPIDALRSFKRYVAEGFPEAEVRLAEEEGTFDRPYFAIFGQGDLETLAGPRYHIDHVQTLVAHGYPEPKATPIESRLGAEAMRMALLDLIEVGVGLGSRRRIPLWDYAGVGATAPATRRGASDYLRVERFTVNVIPDADDNLLYEVVGSVRCGWRRRGQVASGPTVVGVDIEAKFV